MLAPFESPYSDDLSAGMNIFVLHPNPKKAAKWHADKHVIKMILEAVQMLYTAHWVVAYPSLLNCKSPIALSQAQKKLPTPPHIRSAPLTLIGQRGYRPVHIHHPCTKWARASKENYIWLCRLAIALAEEHDYRWPYNPSHSCEVHARWLLTHVPSIPSIPQTPFAVAMPVEVKKHDPIVSYRAFYRGSKSERGITSSYTGRHRPHWL